MRKNIRNFLVCMIVSAAALSFAGAEAASVPQAALPVEAACFEHYTGHALDEESGKWSVHANQADALIDRFQDFAGRYNAEACVFHLAIEGDLHTGAWSPVLVFYHAGGREDIHATAVSLLADGVRYDLAAVSSMVGSGRNQMEQIKAPLDAQSLEVVQALLKGRSISVRLMGQAVYTTTLDHSSRQDRQLLEAASMEGLEAGLALLEEAGLSSYQLWDLSAAAWKKEYGFAPAYQQGDVITKIDGVEVEDPFGMVMLDNRTAAAKAAQQVLVKNGYLSGSPAASFDDKAMRAVVRAQKYLGLIETGCMDAQLERALSQGRKAETQEQTATLDLGGMARIGLNRYWFANGVRASAGDEGLRVVSNTDNLFLVADGCLENLSVQQLHLFMQMDAKVVCGGMYVYDAEVVVECNGGRSLDQVLLPMAQARVMVYAEVPSALVNDADAEWSIEVSCGNDSLVFDLQ